MERTMKKTRKSNYWHLLATLAAASAIWPVATACDETSTVPPSAGQEGTGNGGGATFASAKGGGTASASPDAMTDAGCTLDPAVETAKRMIEEGRETFRFDTFGDEAFWGDTLKLHQAIAGEANGGVGVGVSPKTALTVGLKVDAEAIPADVANLLRQGKVNLDDPKSTLLLLQVNAVVGVKGFFENDMLTSVGIQCALCHSTVDDSFAPGIGKRIDGQPNRDLNVGAIVSLAPDLSAFTKLLGVDVDTVKAVLASWGPGKFDAELILDGKGLRPDGKTAATLLPPAYGLSGVNLHTYTGWGSVTYWNAFVANLEMHGKGTFYDPRLDDEARFPIAARNGMGHVVTPPAEDRITRKLANLHFYQLALKAPEPKPGSFDKQAAKQGQELFLGKAKCANCHVPPLFTEPGWNMHTPEEIGIDNFQSERSPDQHYRTTPLRGVSSHSKGGFYHDGRFATLLDVVNHYDTLGSLGLTDGEKSAIVEYLKSL
jgi:hypothetical protein